MGTALSETGTLNPIYCGYDFGLQSGKGILDLAGLTIECGPADLHTKISDKHIICAEASFGSYGTNEEYNEIIIALGPRLRKISNRAVKNYKTEHGLKHKDKNLSDDGAHALDAQILTRIAQESPARLGFFTLRESQGKAKSVQHEHKNLVHQDLNKHMNELRHETGYLLGKNNKPHKAETNWLRARTWLRANKFKTSSALLAAYGVAEFILSRNPTAGRNDFEAILGWHDHAYPTMPRGHTMYYLPRKMKGKDTYTVRKEYLRTIRKQSRHIFAKLKGTPNPVTGTIDPLTKPGAI